MKHKLLLIIAAVIALTSCSNDKENESATTGMQNLTVRTYTNENNTDNERTLFTGDDIKSYNTTTGELKFNKDISKVFIGLTGDLVFDIDENTLFKAQYVNPLASYIINDLVLDTDLEGSYFLKDGYPEVSSVTPPDDNPGNTQDSTKVEGVSYVTYSDGVAHTNISEKDIAEREANKQKRAAEWTKFLEWLKKENKLVK